MIHLLLQIFPVILFIFFISACRKNANSGEYFSCLSLDSTKCFKGLAAVLIVLHHISLKVESGGFVYRQFAKMGWLLTSVFFFYSGYGLMHKCINEPDYGKAFFRKRIIKVLVPFAVALAIYYVVYLLLGYRYSFLRVVRGVLNGGFIPYSWFIVCIVAFYLFFWLSLRIRNNKPCVLITLSVLFCLIWGICFAISGWGEEWYNSVHMIPFGMIVATYKDKLEKIVKKHYILCAVGIWVPFVLLFGGGGKLSEWVASPVASYVIDAVTSLLFILAVLLFSVMFRFKNRIFNWFGKISLEMYLMQGLFIKILFNPLLKLYNEFLYAFLCLTGTFIMAFAVNSFDRFVLKSRHK